MKSLSAAIAIIGAHGSGKTTLVSIIKRLLKRKGGVAVAFVDEVARECPYNTGDRSDEIAQTWILLTQQLVESFSCALGLPVILDRCLIDQYAYYSYWVDYDAELEEMIIKSLSRYHSIFLLKSNPQYLINDGVRPSNIDFQKNIDERIQLILDKLKVPAIRADDYGEDTTSSVISIIEKISSQLQGHSGVLDVSQINTAFAKNVMPPFGERENINLIKKLVRIESFNVTPPLSSVHLRSREDLVRQWLVDRGVKVT